MRSACNTALFLLLFHASQYACVTANNTGKHRASILVQPAICVVHRMDSRRHLCEIERAFSRAAFIQVANGYRSLK